MLFRDVIDLVNITLSPDAEGYDTNIVQSRSTVFADKRDVRSNEFYLSQQAGFKLQFMFIIKTIEFNGENYVQFEGEYYRIIRTYTTGDTMEIVCQLFNEKVVDFLDGGDGGNEPVSS
jgi:SPP1 family predicted phage head-tail adaptor